MIKYYYMDVQLLYGCTIMYIIGVQLWRDKGHPGPGKRTRGESPQSVTSDFVSKVRLNMTGFFLFFFIFFNAPMLLIYIYFFFLKCFGHTNFLKVMACPKVKTEPSGNFVRAPFLSLVMGCVFLMEYKYWMVESQVSWAPTPPLIPSVSTHSTVAAEYCAPRIACGW